MASRISRPGRGRLSSLSWNLSSNAMGTSGVWSNPSHEHTVVMSISGSVCRREIFRRSPVRVVLALSWSAIFEMLGNCGGTQWIPQWPEYWAWQPSFVSSTLALGYNRVQLFAHGMRYLLVGGSSCIRKSATEMPNWRYIACLKHILNFVWGKILNVQIQDWDSNSSLLFNQSSKSVCRANSDFPAVHSSECTCWKYTCSSTKNLHCSVLYLIMAAECMPAQGFNQMP
jgi:hypothetical protein